MSKTSTPTSLPALPRPDASPMRPRSYRSSDQENRAAADRARAEGLTLTDVIRHYLREYAAGDPRA